MPPLGLVLETIQALRVAQTDDAVKTNSYHKLNSDVLAQYPAGILAGFDVFVQFIDSNG